MWRHTQAVKCMLKGDFITYPALICPVCNGYPGLSGNGAIKKRKKKRRDWEFRRREAERWEKNEMKERQGKRRRRNEGSLETREETKQERAERIMEIKERE